MLATIVHRLQNFPEKVNSVSPRVRTERPEEDFRKAELIFDLEDIVDRHSVEHDGRDQVEALAEGFHCGQSLPQREAAGVDVGEVEAETNLEVFLGYLAIWL